MTGKETTTPIFKIAGGTKEGTDEGSPKTMTRIPSKVVRLARGTVLALERAAVRRSGDGDRAGLSTRATTNRAGLSPPPPKGVTDMTDTRRTTQRSGKMLTQKIAHRDFGLVEDMLTSLADGAGGPSLLLVDRNVRTALAREQEDAAIEARDVLSQADEALVLG